MADVPGKGVRLPGSPLIWLGGLAAVGVIVYVIWKRNSGSSSSSGASSAGQGSGGDSGGVDEGQIGTLQSEISDLQSSATDERVQVPNVVGQRQEDANGAISGAGLRPAGAAVQPGKTLYVTAQSPAAGVLVRTGSTVALQSAPRPAAKKPVRRPRPRPRPEEKAAA